MLYTHNHHAIPPKTIDNTKSIAAESKLLKNLIFHKASDIAARLNTKNNTDTSFKNTYIKHSII